MKKIAIIIGSVFLLLAATLIYNVWRAGMTPLIAPPGLLEIGRQQLHDQLDQSKKRESEIEQQDWNSITLLRALIKAHQERIDKLTGNSQAEEIVAWDKESIARIQARIADLIAKQSEQPTEPQAAVSAGQQTQEGSIQPGSEHSASMVPKPPANSTGTPKAAAKPNVEGTTKAGAPSSAETPGSTTPKPAPTPKPPATMPQSPSTPGSPRAGN
jgi:hypothetical protein